MHQRVIGALAGEPGGSGEVEGASHLSRRIVRPAEQVGEHQAGAGGCLACTGRSGMGAGWTPSGGELGGAVAQLARGGLLLLQADSMSHRTP